MDKTLKIGTLAPRSSPWGKVFETWIKAVNEKSGGNLELQFFYNGDQGDANPPRGALKQARDRGQHGVALLLGALGRAGVLPVATLDLGPACLLGCAAALQDLSVLRGQRVGCYQDCAELPDRLAALGALVITLVPGEPVPEGLVAFGGGALALSALGRLGQADALLDTGLGRAGCAILLLEEVLASSSEAEQATLRELLAGAAASEAVVAVHDRALALLRRRYRTVRPAASDASTSDAAKVEAAPASAQPIAEVEDATPRERGRGRRRGRGV